MGNKSEKTVEAGKADKVEWDHDMMKDLVVIKDKKTNKQIMEATFAMGNKKDYEDWVNLLSKNPGEKSETAFNPIKHSFQQKGVCGSGGVAKIEYQSSPYMLLSQIFNRKNEQYQHFEESQLWYLLYSLTDLGMLFHNNNKKVGDIRSNNVFMTADGSVMVAHQYSWPGQKTNYKKSRHNQQITYLAPQQVYDLQIGRDETEADFKKSESFSVGLTMLDAALLDNCRKIYNKKMEIDFQILKSMKQNLKNSSYSTIFKHILLNLTEENPKNRVKLADLNKWLQPHERNIINLDPFSIEEQYPPQIKRTAEQNYIKPRNLEFTYNQPQNQQILYSFKNQNRPQQNNFLSQNGQNVSIINREFEGVISGGVSQLENKPPQNYIEEKGSFQKKIEKEISFSRDTPRFDKINYSQPVQGNFILQQPNRGSQFQQAMREQPFDSGANFQRLHSPQFRSNSMIINQQPIDLQRNQFSHPIQGQQPRFSQPYRPNFVSPPPRVVPTSVPFNYNKPMVRQQSHAFAVGNTEMKRPYTESMRVNSQNEPVRMERIQNLYAINDSVPIHYNKPLIRQQDHSPTMGNQRIQHPNSNYMSPQSQRQSSHMESIQRQQSHPFIDQRTQTFHQVPSYSQPVITQQQYVPKYVNTTYQFDVKNSSIIKQPSNGLSNQNVNTSQYDPDQYFDPEKSQNKKKSENLIHTIEQRIRSSKQNFPSYINTD